MKWAEFAALLGGLGENTALARVVSIRLENDAERLKLFTPAQHRIRNAWLSSKAQNVSVEERDAAVLHYQNIFKKMCGK